MLHCVPPLRIQILKSRAPEELRTETTILEHPARGPAYRDTLRRRDPRPTERTNRSRCTPAALAWILALAGCTLPAPTRPSRTLRGDHFEIVAPFSDAGLGLRVLEVAEAAWPYAVELYGASPDAIDPPLRLYLYATADEYRRAEAARTGGRFRSHLAFSHVASRSAHVALQPTVSGTVLGRIGLPAQTLRLVAHEAVHLASYHACPNAPYFPSWLDEGAATWVEQRVAESHGLTAPAESFDPWAGRYAVIAQHLLDQGQLPSVADILDGRITQRKRGAAYAIDKSFFSFLWTHGGTEFRNAVPQLVRTAAPRDLGRTLADAVRAAFEDPELHTVDAAFKEYVDSRRPVWFERQRSLATGSDWIQVAFTEHDALSTRTEPEPRETFALEGSLEILPSGGRALFVTLEGQVPGDRLEVEFRAGRGITIYRLEKGRRRVVVRGATTIDTERALSFRIEVQPRLVGVHIGPDQICGVATALDELDGRWGVGARAGSAGRWQGVTAVPIDLGASDAP